MIRQLLALLLLLLLPVTVTAQEEETTSQMQIRGNVRFLNQSGEKVKGPNVLYYTALNRDVAHEAGRRFKEAFAMKDDNLMIAKIESLISEYKITSKSTNGSFRRNVLPTMSLIFVNDEDNEVLVLDVKEGQTQYKDIEMKVKRIKEVESVGTAKEVAINMNSTDDADDGNERFRIRIEIPAGTARTDSRMIMQVFAVDCQTEDTLDHCASLVFEGEQFHRMQERRMAFDYDANDRLAQFYRRNAVLDESKRFVLDTVIVWPRPKDMKTRSFRGPCTYSFEDYHHPYYFFEMEGSCLKRRPFKMLDFKAALANMELSDEFFQQAEQQVEKRNIRLDLRFEKGTATLTADSMNAVLQNKLVRELSSYGKDLLTLNIQGAASPDGSAKRNTELAQQRAQVARQMLRGLPITPTVTVKLYTWADVIKSLRDATKDDEAQQIEALVAEGGDEGALSRKIAELPFYDADVVPVLNRQRVMSASYQYNRERILTPEECVDEFRKHKQAYWEGTRHFSAGDFWNLYDMLDDKLDSLEVDTLTQIAYREITSEMDYETENAMSPYVCNRMAMLQIKRGIPNVETLKPFIDLKRYANGGASGIDVKRWTASRGNIEFNRHQIVANQAAAYYMEQKPDTALFLLGWLKGCKKDDENTAKLEALINLKQLHFKNRNGKEEADYQSAKRNVLSMSDENKAILYTEIEEWGQRKNVMPWIDKMDDDNPKKWYLKGIMAAANVEHEEPLIVTPDGADDGADGDQTLYKWSEEKMTDYQWSEDPKKQAAYEAYTKKLLKYREEHDGQDPPAEPATVPQQGKTAVNVDMFKGIPQYLAYFQHCFDLDPTRTYFRYYHNDVQVNEDLRKKFKYKLKNCPLYRQMFRLLKQRDDAAAATVNSSSDDGAGDEGATDGDTNTGDTTANEKKEDTKS